MTIMTINNQNTIGVFTNKIKKLSTNPQLAQLVNKKIIKNNDDILIVDGTNLIISNTELQTFIKLGCIKPNTNNAPDKIKPNKQKHSNKTNNIIATGLTNITTTSSVETKQQSKSIEFPKMSPRTIQNKETKEYHKRKKGVYDDIDTSQYDKLFETSEFLKRGPNKFWEDLPKNEGIRNTFGEASDKFWTGIDKLFGKGLDKLDKWSQSNKLDETHPNILE